MARGRTPRSSDGKYAKAADLPPKDTGPRRFGTEVWLKLDEHAAGVGRQAAAGERLRLGREGRGRGRRSRSPRSDRMVWGKGKLWQHTLTLLAAQGSERAKAWA